MCISHRCFKIIWDHKWLVKLCVFFFPDPHSWWISLRWSWTRWISSVQIPRATNPQRLAMLIAARSLGGRVRSVALRWARHVCRRSRWSGGLVVGKDEQELQGEMEGLVGFFVRIDLFVFQPCLLCIFLGTRQNALSALSCVQSLVGKCLQVKTNVKWGEGTFLQCIMMF